MGGGGGGGQQLAELLQSQHVTVVLHFASWTCAANSRVFVSSLQTHDCVVTVTTQLCEQCVRPYGLDHSKGGQSMVGKKDIRHKNFILAK